MGYVLSDALIAYGKLGFGFTSSTFHGQETHDGVIENYKEGGRTWSVIPAIGMQGHLQGQLSWTAEASYSVPISVMPHDDFKKRPKLLSATVGLTYKF